MGALKKQYPLDKVYQLLGCGPVVLISTSLKGRPNVMPIAWTTPLDFDPPLVACCIGDHSYTFQIVKQTKEFVINIPEPKLKDKIYACGHVSGKAVDKFARFKLTALDAKKVKAPLVKECFANLECKVVDTSMIGKYNLFIARVVAAWTDPGKNHARTLHHITGKRFKVGNENC